MPYRKIPSTKTSIPLTKAERTKQARRLKAAEEVVKKLGGQTMGEKILKHLVVTTIDKASIHSWLKNGIPHYWAELIYDITGVPPWVTNPDTFTRVDIRKYYKPKPTIQRKVQAFRNKELKKKGKPANLI